MRATTSLAILAIAILTGACASGGGAQTAADSNTTARGREVASIDDSFTGEVVGSPAPGAKFARLKIGMSTGEVQDVMDRVPDRQHAYESGKRWIPFYFGNDARRMQVLYKGEGCLIFTDGNVWGSAGGDLIQIEHDPSGACYQP